MTPASESLVALTMIMNRMVALPWVSRPERGRSGSIEATNGGFQDRQDYPPAIAPMTRNGSAPAATASGSGASGGSWVRSRSQAKNRRNRTEERRVGER